GPWIETARLVHAGGSMGDGLGVSAAVDGDVAVVGQPTNLTSTAPGIARVFVRAGGVWSEAASLVPSDSAVGDQFGWSVAISGNTIVVGAWGATISGLAQEGQAYVFVRPAIGWSGTLQESARLLAPDDGALTGPDNLGFSVAISGDTVAVGADGSLGGAGLAFVYVEPRTGWSGTILPSATLKAPTGQAESAGFSVAISADVVVAGAPGVDSRTGEAFVWVKPSSGWAGILTESADLLPLTPFFGGQFGVAVAIDGTTAIVGAPVTQYTNSDNAGTSVAYVFVQPAGGWAGTLNETARLVPSADKLPPPPDAAFGASVSISGDTAVVGTPGLLVFPFSEDDGGAFIFQRPLAGWSGDVGEQAKILRVDSNARQSGLGRSASISGTTVVLGAPRESVGVNAEQGAAHVFEPGLNPLVTASFSPGSVLTYQPSTLTLTITNPNTSGFIWNVSAAAKLSVPAGLFPAAVPNLSNACGGLWTLGGVVLLGFGNGDPLLAGGTCTISADFSSGTPNLYTTFAFPVSCDQGCDGVGSAPATLLVRLRNTQTRFLVEGPIRVAPGVPVELRFQVESRPETALPISGEVVVSDGAGHACRSGVSAGGQGACTLTFDSPGTFQVRASYLGSLSFGGSTSPPANVFVR
ncbi:MAG TPA: hypothetical protein VFL12_01475, partial [Thermoanaerobaculia bacterium]|nr:hypothetical protein [Thermoanaerobaculia bacterium]